MFFSPLSCDSIAHFDLKCARCRETSNEETNLLEVQAIRNYARHLTQFAPIEAVMTFTATELTFLPLATTKITWDTSGSVAEVNVRFEGDGDCHAAKVCGAHATSIPNIGEFQWTAPMLLNAHRIDSKLTVKFDFVVVIESANDKSIASKQSSSLADDLPAVQAQVSDPSLWRGNGASVNVTVLKELPVGYEVCGTSSGSVVRCPSARQYWGAMGYGKYQMVFQPLIATWCTPQFARTHSA